jgi:hypothetical protein
MCVESDINLGYCPQIGVGPRVLPKALTGRTRGGPLAEIKLPVRRTWDEVQPLNSVKVGCRWRCSIIMCSKSPLLRMYGELLNPIQ